MHTLSPQEEQRYAEAFAFKNAGKFEEAIHVFKDIIEEYGESGVATGMIANLYYCDLRNPTLALPYAQRAVQLSPKSELASFCFVLCLVFSTSIPRQPR
jgi:tetratricopeptide (TPR) repeat protein